MSEPIPRRGEPEVMDDLAEAQAYAAADFADVNEAFVARLLELAGPPAKARAVDLGTGPGDIPIRLVRARPGWHVTAVDASLAMLNLARQAIDASAMYHPRLGRFLSRDPGAGSAMRIGAGGAAPVGGFIPRDPSQSNQYADGMNLYQYVGSHPISYVDPMGLHRDFNPKGPRPKAISATGKA